MDCSRAAPRLDAEGGCPPSPLSHIASVPTNRHKRTLLPAQTTVHAGPHTAVRSVSPPNELAGLSVRSLVAPCGFHFSSQHPLRLHRAPCPPNARRSGMVSALPSSTPKHYLPFLSFGPSSLRRLRRPLLTPAIRPEHLAMSSVTIPCHTADPEISSTTFDTRLPDLPPVSLMDMGFAITRQLARHRRFDRLRRATTGFTTSELDGYGLCSPWPARPPP